MGGRPLSPVDGRLFAYNLALGAMSPALIAYLAWRLGVQGKSREGWRQRFGLYRPPFFRDEYFDRRRIWVHAVSAGEVTAAVPIIDAPVDAMVPAAAYSEPVRAASPLARSAAACVSSPAD